MERMISRGGKTRYQFFKGRTIPVNTGSTQYPGLEKESVLTYVGQELRQIPGFYITHVSGD